MPIDAFVPQPLLTAIAAAAVFAFMFHLGLTLAPAALRDAWAAPALMSKSLFCALVAVPLIALAAARALQVPRDAQVGIVLMAISPGAPVALRRSLGAGADAAFAAALQATMAILAVVTMPLSVALFDEVFAGHARVEPWQLAVPVIVGQLLPLSVGLAARRRLARYERGVGQAATALLALLLAAALVDIWRPVMQAGWHVASTIAIVTAASLATGHAMGGPATGTRTALGVACGARNAGLAMLVATVNEAPTPVQATVLAYLVVSAVVVTPYVMWRRSALDAVPGFAQKTNLP